MHGYLGIAAAGVANQAVFLLSLFTMYKCTLEDKVSWELKNLYLL